MRPDKDYTTRLFALGSLLLALAFLLPGYLFGLGAALDKLNYRLWSGLFPPQQVQAAEQLAVVELPPEVSETSGASLATTQALNQLFTALGKYQPAAIGMVSNLDPLIWPQQSILQLLSIDPSGDRTLQRLTQPYQELQRQVQQLDVNWHHQPPRLEAPAVLIDREFNWPILFSLHDRLLQYRFERQLPNPQQRYLFNYEKGRVVAGFELTVLAKAYQANSLRWQIPDTLRAGSLSLPVSMYGSIMPWPQDSVVAALQARMVRPELFDADSIGGKIVLLTRPGDPQLAASITSINALLTNQYSITPWWQMLVLAPVMLLIWVFGMFAFRRFTSGAIWLATATLIGLLAVLSAAALVQRGIWIETGDAIAYSLCICVVLLAQSIYHNWLIRTRAEADEVRMELAQLYLEQGKPKPAAEQLLLTAMSGDTADLLMETGKVFERKRDYQAARDVYSKVNSYFPSHPEAGDALDDISSITGQHPSLNSTLILSDMPVELPQLGRYELIRLLGKGAMGAVYLASDPTIRRQVAIKTLQLHELGDNREELRERFLLEAETAGKLQHPNIVSVYDVGEEGDLAYIAMDYVSGGALADWTDEDHLLELPTLYALMEQVCDGLSYAHAQGVVHRDIKPGNILYDPEQGTIKVTDFGIARLADYSRTKTGAILGSPYYMSPEQISGKKVGPASDLYSLGVSFYQLLSGNLPFEAESLAQLAWQITNKPHRSIGKFRKGLPRSASRIINTALKKAPTERFANAAEMAAAFQKGAKSLAASERHSALSR